MLLTSGWFHEQSRPDRDQYVKIKWENIMSGMESNFDILSADAWDDLSEPYDMKSAMHYEGNAFSKNGYPTIVYADTGLQVSIGATMLSSTDIIEIKKRYSDYCIVDESDRIPCDPDDPSGPYYLSSKMCDGQLDCDNGADEEHCDDCTGDDCAEPVCSTYAVIKKPNLWLQGNYKRATDFFKGKHYWTAEIDGDLVIIYSMETWWAIGYELGQDFVYAWIDGDGDCPPDSGWYLWDNDNQQWVVYNFKIQFIDNLEEITTTTTAVTTTTTEVTTTTLTSPYGEWEKHGDIKPGLTCQRTQKVSFQICHVLTKLGNRWR